MGANEQTTVNHHLNENRDITEKTQPDKPTHPL